MAYSNSQPVNNFNRSSTDSRPPSSNRSHSDSNRISSLATSNDVITHVTPNSTFRTSSTKVHGAGANETRADSPHQRIARSFHSPLQSTSRDYLPSKGLTYASNFGPRHHENQARMQADREKNKSIQAASHNTSTDSSFFMGFLQSLVRQAVLQDRFEQGQVRFAAVKEQEEELRKTYPDHEKVQDLRGARLRKHEDELNALAVLIADANQKHQTMLEASPQGFKDLFRGVLPGTSNLPNSVKLPVEVEIEQIKDELRNLEHRDMMKNKHLKHLQSSAEEGQRQHSEAKVDLEKLLYAFEDLNKRLNHYQGVLDQYSKHTAFHEKSTNQHSELIPDKQKLQPDTAQVFVRSRVDNDRTDVKTTVKERRHEHESNTRFSETDGMDIYSSSQLRTNLQPIVESLLATTLPPMISSVESELAFLQKETKVLHTNVAKVDHSVQSLSSRYNSITTRQLHKAIMATISPQGPMLSGLVDSCKGLGERLEDLEHVCQNMHNEVEVYKASNNVQDVLEKVQQRLSDADVHRETSEDLTTLSLEMQSLSKRLEVLETLKEKVLDQRSSSSEGEMIADEQVRSDNAQSSLPLLGHNLLSRLQHVVENLASCLFNPKDNFIKITNLASNVNEARIKRRLPEGCVRKVWFHGRKNTTDVGTTRYALVQICGSTRPSIIESYSGQRWNGRVVEITGVSLDKVKHVLMAEPEPTDITTEGNDCDERGSESHQIVNSTQPEITPDEDQDTIVVNTTPSSNLQQDESNYLRGWITNGRLSTSVNQPESASTSVTCSLSGAEQIATPSRGIKRKSGNAKQSFELSRPPGKRKK